MEKYKGWLISDNFLKRAFAVWGYNIVANVIMWIILFILVSILDIIGI